MMRAEPEGVDVISISIGEPWVDETTNSYSAVTSKLIERGIAVFAANGNAAGAGVPGVSTPSKFILYHTPPEK